MTPDAAGPARDEVGALGPVGRRAAADLGFADDELARVEPPAEPPRWRSALRVAELAVDSVALASLALNAVLASRSGQPGPAPVRVDGARVAASYGSDRLLRIDGTAPDVWSPLSGFWRAEDGWIRTHGNYPHHAERLRGLLGLGSDAQRADVERAVARRSATALEEAAAEHGALAIAVRDPQSWRAHPQARAVAGAPLVALDLAGPADPRRWRAATAPQRNGLPLAGVRVLDLTRVIAGPVATRDLALAGADVLRVDSPHLPEIEWQHLDTGHGKRSTRLDLGARRDRRDFDELLASADVLALGYRPGALERLGLDPATLAEHRAGLVIAEVSAWGVTGPWSRRRGFDSLVQAASGIAIAESRDAGATPGALPVQALDHSAGHLLAAAVATALRRQRASGGTLRVGVSLARVAQELLEAGPAGAQPTATEDRLPTATAPLAGPEPDPPVVTTAPPPLAFAAAPEVWPRMARPWGRDAPTWDPLPTTAHG
ncbi:CoA transferase [Microbacterium album]|uniref:CoA transferase n=1 Tax=Microbacterium album TaxID=2053191 RepID=A0A917MLP0_9MICO|nr:CoA transferase [Microbacterium album]GGH43747.1 CoA transferase [Microbacterium album]